MSRIIQGGALLAMALAAITLAACGEQESISTYSTPRTGPRLQRMDPDGARASLDHMFTAVVPDGEQAWFFKLVAPATAADKVREPFNDFVDSIELQKDGKPAWKLAEGWKEKPGDQVRAATIEIPQEGEPLELTVTTLPLSGAWERYLEQNVARWLDQLQQAPLKRDVIAKIGKKKPLKNGEATVFELVGVMDRRGAMPPGHPPVAKASDQPASASTAATTSTPPADAKDAELSYDAPEHWKAGPASSMRKASFVATRDGGQADLSVTTFAAVPMMADPLANARRWAGEVGMSGASDEELKGLVADLEIGGLKGHYMEFMPPADSGAQATLAAMVKRGEQMWFFKLKGDRAVVEGERDAFRQFIESVRFAEK